MRHRSFVAVGLLAALFVLGSARQADAQVYLQVGYGSPYAYTSSYPGYETAYPYTAYSYPRYSTYASPYSSGFPYSYGNRSNYGSNYNYRSNYNYGSNYGSNYNYNYNYRYNSGYSNRGGRGWRR